MGLRKATTSPERWEAYLVAMRAYNASEAGQKYNKEWREAHAGYPHEETYARLLIEQNGLCAICKKPETHAGRRLSIDHDHSCCPGRTSCGKCIRGLLCNRCNRAISHLGEHLIAAALAYLLADQNRRFAT